MDDRSTPEGILVSGLNFQSELTTFSTTVDCGELPLLTVSRLGKLTGISCRPLPRVRESSVHRATDGVRTIGKRGRWVGTNELQE